MSEATKKRRPSGGGEPAPVLTVVIPAGDSTASGMGKKSAAALGKTLRKAAKAADGAGLAVTLDLDALGRTRQGTKNKASAKGKTIPKDEPSTKDEPSARKSGAKSEADSATAAVVPEPVTPTAAAQLPSSRGTTRTAPRAAPAAGAKTPATKVAATKVAAKKVAAGKPTVARTVPAPDQAESPTPVAVSVPSGARRPRRTPRRTPARPPVTG